MVLKPPFSISSRLLAALVINDATLSMEFVGVRNNRLVSKAYWDLPGGREVEDEGPPARRDNLQEAFAAYLSFLGAALESRAHRVRRGEECIDPDGSERLFPKEVLDWAEDNSDEIDLLCDVVSTPGLITPGDG